MFPAARGYLLIVNKTTTLVPWALISTCPPRVAPAGDSVRQCQ